MKRYDLELHGYDGAEMIECKDGDYVKFEDAQKLIEALKYYANENSWNEVWVDSGGDDNAGDCACQIEFEDVEIKRDAEGTIYYSTGGNKARQTIKDLGIEHE